MSGRNGAETGNPHTHPGNERPNEMNLPPDRFFREKNKPIMIVAAQHAGRPVQSKVVKWRIICGPEGWKAPPVKLNCQMLPFSPTVSNIFGY